MTTTELADYVGIILIGGYATNRLRYQTDITPGMLNTSPAVEFLRKAVKETDEGRLKIGTICHSLCLFCADKTLLAGRHVTCAHNIVCDVENADGIVEFNDILDRLGIDYTGVT